MPLIIRDNSISRSDPPTSLRPELVTAPSEAFVMTTWVSAKAATWARWVTTCQLTQSPPNLDADRTSDTGVDLVEDEGLWGLGLCRDDLEGQPHSRQLTT